MHARGREWVALPSFRAGWLNLRPLSGSEADSVLLDPELELEPPRLAYFDLPQDAASTTQASALLLADALRLTLRRGAGPFRSAAQLGFEPRIYQLVPLLLALKLAVPRLLIADDVGIGKTIEAGLVLRELMDRGEVDAFSVLCPPHLVEQWTSELQDRFGIDAVAVTASSAVRLERGLPVAQTLFDAHPYTVVSLDYIKAERRRDAFARCCPDFVIIDEAHACVGTHQGRQQRFELLRGLAADTHRRLLLLTATPHSGDEDAFARLLGLIDPEFAALAFDDARYREKLARHFVQRRRIDLTSGDWTEERAFPRHQTTEAPFHLSPIHRDFQEAVLDYCFSVVERAGTQQRERRLAFWGTLALMRCVGSSPAAALAALRNRAQADAERLEPQVYDDDGDDEDAVDVEPGTSWRGGDPELDRLLRLAERLSQQPDPKLNNLISVLQGLLQKNANPVVFCRFIATAEYVAERLRTAFPRLRVAAVTGLLTPDERREQVASLAAPDDPAQQRLLVATDCLSEGINLQQWFDAVIHYDLSWNPTRHQQREGRVDRFGQPAAQVHSVMLFSPDSAIDGAVLDVILRKAEEIRRATGVTVPLPEERGPVTDALIASMLLRRGDNRQLTLDLGLEERVEQMALRWRDVQDKEKRSRARFAQHALKPQEVAPEWNQAAQFLGSPAAAQDFVASALRQFNAPLELRRGLQRGRELQLAHLDALTPALRERLEQRGLTGSLRLATAEPAPSGSALLTRTHPLTATLAEGLLEASLDPSALPGLGLGRVGAWPIAGISERTLIALLRIRYQLTVHGRRERRLLLAEEATLLALAGGQVVATGAEARAWLATTACHDLTPATRTRQIERSHAEWPTLLAGPIAAECQRRADALAADHGRLRAAAGVSRVTVAPVLPPDVIGLFTVLPEA